MPRNRKTSPEIYGLSQFRGIRHEECGLLTPFGEKFFVIKVPNHAFEAEDNFAIAKASVERVKLRGIEVVGFLHTHLPHHEASASGTDLLGAELNPEMLHVIYKPSTGELTWFKPVSG